MTDQGSEAPKGILKSKGDESAVKAIQNATRVNLPSAKTLQKALQDAEVNKERNKRFQEERAKELSASEEAKKKQKRSLQWDEANLQLNEEEKVPRMKIDEPPTPYYKSTDTDFSDVEDLELDGDHQADRRSSVNFDAQPGLNLDENAAAELVSKAVERRTDAENEANSRMRAWENSGSNDDADMQDDDDEESEEEVEELTAEEKEKQQKFKQKRKAHYNEYQAMLAMRAKMAAEEDDESDTDEDEAASSKSSAAAKSS